MVPGAAQPAPGGGNHLLYLHHGPVRRREHHARAADRLVRRQLIRAAAVSKLGLLDQLTHARR